MEHARGVSSASPATRLGIVLVALVLSCQLYTVFKRHNIAQAAVQLQVHEQVIAGTARAPLQYQLYVHDHILEQMFSFAPKRTPIWFSAVHMTYYTIGLMLFIALLYRLCLRFGSPAAAFSSVLYLAAIINMFWFDNDYHPNDPWGAALAVALVGELLKAKRGWQYFALLFISGFVWEKHVFVPFSVAAMELLFRRSTRFQITMELAVSLGLALFGQLLPRILFGTDRSWYGPPMSYNFTQMHLYVWGMAVVFGLPILYLVLRRTKVQLPLQMLALQFPVWALIYLLTPGVLREMRGIIIMVPFTWPIMVQAIDEWIIEPSLRRSASPASAPLPAASDGEVLSISAE
jgi:hypothetical protein